MLTEWEAVERRVSCRAYQDRTIEEETLRQLTEKVQELNQASGLRFQFYTTRNAGEPALKLSSAMFAGKVYHYAALVGGDDPLSAEKVGYYGQKLVLYATQLGLGTCWVAGTYDPDSIQVELAQGEKVWDVVPMGYPAEKTPMKQKMIRSGIRARDRKLEQFVESQTAFAHLPEWLRKGVEAIKLGPSAVNQQPVNIVYQDGTVSAKLWKSGHGLEFNDLGIAKCQFEAGVAACGVRGTWDFGDGGVFRLQAAGEG